MTEDKIERLKLLETKWSRPVKVLDNGFVRVVDFMGTSMSMPEAARVSYSEGTQILRGDRDLLRFLMRNKHFSPFSMAQIKLHVRFPKFVRDQWIRHDRFHFNLMSGRYSEMPKEKWTPALEEIRAQGKGNKQVANGSMSKNKQWLALNLINVAYRVIQLAYDGLLKLGVGREQARTVLPSGQYTEGYITANLGDWLMFLNARLDSHSQKEIRVYAEAIARILEEMFPEVMEAFYDYQVNAQTFSIFEMNAIKAMLKGVYFEKWPDAKYDGPDIDVMLIHDRWSTEQRRAFLEEHIPTKRERIEFWKKING